MVSKNKKWLVFNYTGFLISIAMIVVFAAAEETVMAVAWALGAILWRINILGLELKCQNTCT